ncbi:MAG: nitrous oxide reductase family maturation protein NosD [Salinibacter sp.]
MRFFWALTFGLLLSVGPGLAQPSLQARIDAAAPGDTVTVDGGTHAGALTIDQPLVLQGENRPHLRGNEQTHVVTITAPDVTVEGFRITGSGTRLNEDHAGILVKGDRATIRNNHLADVLHGIYVKGKSRAVIVENRIAGPPTVARHVSPEEARQYDDCSVPPAGGECEVPLSSSRRGNGIHLWKSVHNTITHNTVHHTRDGVYFSYTDHTYAAHNRIHHVRYGLHFMYSDDNVFEYNRFTHNASGSALMFSFRLTARHNVFHSNRSQRGYGLLLQTIDDSRFVDNRLTENGTGLYLENSTGNTFEQNVVAANYRGLRFTGSSMDNRFGRNVIRGNLNTATVAGASETNVWHMDGRGNYWGPRGLLDVDADGVSELPHHTVDLFGARRASFPYVDLLAGSPGLALLSEALGRVAGTGVPTLTDTHALMEPPVAPDESDHDVPLLTLVLTVLLLAGGWAALRRHFL